MEPAIPVMAVIGAIAASVIVVRFATASLNGSNAALPLFRRLIRQSGSYVTHSMPCKNGLISSSARWLRRGTRVAVPCQRRVSARAHRARRLDGYAAA